MSGSVYCLSTMRFRVSVSFRVFRGRSFGLRSDGLLQIRWWLPETGSGPVRSYAKYGLAPAA
jgi:hypothetical protein